jgi:hypothetical protein
VLWVVLAGVLAVLYLEELAEPLLGLVAEPLLVGLLGRLLELYQALPPEH